MKLEKKNQEWVISESKKNTPLEIAEEKISTLKSQVDQLLDMTKAIEKNVLKLAKSRDPQMYGAWGSIFNDIRTFNKKYKAV